MEKQTQNIKVAISSCPNDTFSFYHFLHHPPEGFDFTVDYLDIEQLNEAALQQNAPYDLVKVSFALAPLIQQKYVLLNAGSALGFGVGPILIAQDALALEKLQKQKTFRLALPGKHTTAAFLWEYFFHKKFKEIPQENIEKHYMVFSDILSTVQKNEVDAGVLIHEGRFVYQKLALHLLQDLGQFWEQDSSYAVPLGGIFARKNLPPTTIVSLEKHLSESVALAFAEKKQNSNMYQKNMLPYIKKYSQELEEDVLEKHISYYVNEETQKLSQKGNEAIDFFYRQYNSLMK